MTPFVFAPSMALQETTLRGRRSKSALDMNSLQPLIDRIYQYRPRRFAGSSLWFHSSVAILLKTDRESGPCVLLIQRATREGDPWSGHMAFPGGRLSPQDHFPLDAAIRETYEETGFDVLGKAYYVGQLSEVITRSHRWPGLMTVTPFVFRLKDTPIWALNHEVAEVVWVPLAFLTNFANRQQMTRKFLRIDWKLPCYFLAGRALFFKIPAELGRNCFDDNHYSFFNFVSRHRLENFQN